MADKVLINKKDAAELYSTVAHHAQNPDGLETIETLDPKPGDTVLDLGCGIGYLSSVLAEKVGTEGRVVAVDPDEERIKVAKREYGNVTNLTFHDGNSDDFPDVGNGCYDAVFSNYVLHFIADKEKVFRRVYDSLKPGGKLCFRYSSSKVPLVEEAARVLTPEILPAYYKKLCIEPEVAVKEYCLRSGFKIIQSNAHTAACFFKSRDDFLNFCFASLHGLFDFSSITEAKKDEFRPPLDERGRVVCQYGSAILLATKE